MYICLGERRMGSLVGEVPFGILDVTLTTVSGQGVMITVIHKFVLDLLGSGFGSADHYSLWTSFGIWK